MQLPYSESTSHPPTYLSLLPGLTTVMLYSTASQTRTFCDYSSCKIRWPGSSVPHHTAVHLLHYYSPCIGSQLPNELSTRLQLSHSRHGSIINLPVCTICSIITYQPVHCDHLPPTCYRNRQQLPRHPRSDRAFDSSLV